MKVKHPFNIKIVASKDKKLLKFHTTKLNIIIFCYISLTLKFSFQISPNSYRNFLNVTHIMY